MKIKKSVHFEEADVLLERDIDYIEDQLVPDRFTNNIMKSLSAEVATEIAKQNGFECWSWMDWERNGQIQMKFRRSI